MLTFKRYPEYELTFFVVEPDTPFQEWVQGIEAYDRAGETKYEMYDTRKMTITPSEKDVQEVLRHHQQYASTRPDGSKTAILVSNVKEHWLVRLYSTLARVVDAHWQTQAFFTLEEAKTWLDIPWPPEEDL
jgi:hypothetical protein